MYVIDEDRCENLPQQRVVKFSLPSSKEDNGTSDYDNELVARQSNVTTDSRSR